MRGCLFVLLFAAVVLGAAAWFGSGPLASAAIGAALQGSGYRSSGTTITVTSEPPPRLLLGQADRVAIDGSDVDWQTLHAGRVRLLLDEVDLFGRTADHVTGTIDDARIDDGRGGSATASSIEVAGPLEAASATITIEADTVRTLVQAAAAGSLPVQVTDVQLVGPDRLRLVTSGATVEGSLVVDPDGTLAFATPLGSVPMLRIDPASRLTLRSADVVDGRLRLIGTLDLASLLRA
ncbi:MAG TPA: hypothetical protein VH440_09680 [Candidatus Limnocylindrales bacterium]|jgi:hypothetical protein